MRWKENRRVVQDTAGRGRAFMNVGRVMAGPMPEEVAPEYALWWAQRIKQVGTRASGGVTFVELSYADPPGGSERFHDGAAINAILSAVGRYRVDVGQGWEP
jgi:hypothetical protein